MDKNYDSLTPNYLYEDSHLLTNDTSDFNRL